jgi:hypothetical protein
VNDGTIVIGNHVERWIYRLETHEYVYVSIDDYTPGRTFTPEDYKIVIPGDIIHGLIGVLESRGLIHDKDRSEDLKIIDRLIDTVQMAVNKYPTPPTFDPRGV